MMMAFTLSPARRGLPIHTFQRRSMTMLSSNLTLDTDRLGSVDRKTKIVATVGPKSLERIPQLVGAGMNVMRVNCSHGNAEFYQDAVSRLRTAVQANASGPIDFSDGAREDVCAVAFDTKGPEIRTGVFDPSTVEGNQINLERGDVLTFTTDPSFETKGTHETVFVDYPKLPALMDIGSRIFLDDGLISVSVVDKTGDSLMVKANNRAVLGERKGINLPGVSVDLPAVSEKDASDLQLAREMGIDFVFASFIRNKSHVDAVRDIVGHNIRIISKIENLEGLHNIDEILAASDGIMVARGDLGIEIPIENIFVAQKKLVAKANVIGKPVICATQMLESMCENPRPTRAECVDVANAVLDGADAIMLSGETAKGKWPVEAIQTMSSIAKTAEVAVDHRQVFNAMSELVRETSTTESLASAAVHASFKEDAKLIIVQSVSGYLSQLISKYRPGCPVLVLTPRRSTATGLQLCRGLHVVNLPEGTSDKQAVDYGVQVGIDMGIIKPGRNDKIVFLGASILDHNAGEQSTGGNGGYASSVHSMELFSI